MRSKPSVKEFLDVGEKEASQKIRRPKQVYLPDEMLIAIKRRVLEESEKAKSRVTETDIIEQALNEYLLRNKV